MADPELASKLARRLENIDSMDEEDARPHKEPPPAPVLPEKIVPNPYVASDDSVSIDDLIARTLKRNEHAEENKEHSEENNNHVPANNSNDVNSTPATQSDANTSTHPIKAISVDTSFEPHRVGSPVSRNSPAHSLPKTPPPKTTIGELLVKDQQPLPVPPASRCPVIPIQHHVHKNEPKRLPSPEDEGEELERKLAAQRAKKNYAQTPSPNSALVFSNSEGSNSAELSQNHIEPKQTDSTPSESQEPEPEQPHQNNLFKPNNVVETQAEVHADHTNHETFKKSPSPLNQQSSTPPSSSHPPPPPPPPPQLIKNLSREGSVDKASSLKTALDPDDLRHLILEELKKNKTNVEEMIVLRGMKQGSSEKSFSPSRELLEMIQRENGVRSPPPVPPPKPQSRPQSPAITKKFSLDSTSSSDQNMFSERQNKPNPPLQFVHKESSSIDGELSMIFDRRNKINEGETMPEMIHKKLSLYAEFSEFSRKQIRFFNETFKKYDEDGDGFIDFDELKRMMEKLGEAQTHIALKEIIRKVDEDQDNKISLREFFLIFRLSAQNQLGCSEVFQTLADSVDVSKEGVLGAASFFQAKIEEQTKLSKFEQEIKEEQEERKHQEEEKKARREKFLQNKSIFQ